MKLCHVLNSLAFETLRSYMVCSYKKKRVHPFLHTQIFAFIDLCIPQSLDSSIYAGTTIGIKISFPVDCGGDGLCDFLQYHIQPNGIFLKGDLSQSEMHCEWNTSFIKISNNLQLTNVIFRIFGGQTLNSHILAEFKFTPYNFTFQGTTSIVMLST